MLNVSDDNDVHPSEDWLGAIARGTMDTYVSSVFRIPSLTETAARQLATDIGEEISTVSMLCISVRETCSCTLILL